MDFLNNQWIIGIGGGILSGLFVAYVSRYLFSQKDNKEYIQKVNNANREVIYALRSGIAENNFPSLEVLESLINSTSRQNGVNKSDVYDSKQIAEELIKEVMDSSFISSDTKHNYCETLTHLVTEKKEDNNVHDLKYELDVTKEREAFIDIFSIILGITVSLLSTLLAFFSYNTPVDDIGILNYVRAFSNVPPSLSVSIITFTAVLLGLMAIEIKKSKNDEDK